MTYGTSGSAPNCGTHERNSVDGRADNFLFYRARVTYL